MMMVMWRGGVGERGKQGTCLPSGEGKGGGSAIARCMCTGGVKAMCVCAEPEGGRGFGRLWNHLPAGILNTRLFLYFQNLKRYKVEIKGTMIQVGTMIQAGTMIHLSHLEGNVTEGS